MGFNAVRIHQKAEDPRFLFWADRLGLLVWGETAGAYEFSPRAIALLTTEWMEIVRRCRSHPSVVVWVPINESWGVQDIATVPAQQQFSQSLVSLTPALAARPVPRQAGDPRCGTGQTRPAWTAADPERRARTTVPRRAGSLDDHGIRRHLDVRRGG